MKLKLEHAKAERVKEMMRGAAVVAALGPIATFSAAFLEPAPATASNTSATTTEMPHTSKTAIVSFEQETTKHAKFTKWVLTNLSKGHETVVILPATSRVIELKLAEGTVYSMYPEDTTSLSNKGYFARWELTYGVHMNNSPPSLKKYDGIKFETNGTGKIVEVWVRGTILQ